MTEINTELLKYGLERVLEDYGLELIERDGLFLIRFADADAYHIAVRHKRASED